MPTRPYTFVLLALALNGAFSTAHAQDSCPHGSPDAARAALEKALTSAPTCRQASQQLRACAWGSTADIDFANIVIQKCERKFLPDLSPAALQRYRDRQDLCTEEFRQQDGTMFRSADALCHADLAYQYAVTPALRTSPVPRASFACERAFTPLEHAICSNPDLGKADIVLSRAYKPLLKSASPAERPQIIRFQRAWHEQVPTTCGLRQPQATSTQIACLRKAFEDRATALDACSAGGAAECIEDLNRAAKP